MTGSDSNSDSLPISRDDAVVILEQADLAVQAGAPLAEGLRAMAAEVKLPMSLVIPAAAELILIAIVILVHLFLLQYFTIAAIGCALIGVQIAAPCGLSLVRAARSRGALTEMARRLEAGEPLPRVLAMLRSRVSPMMLTLIEHGSGIGRFDTVMHWAAEQGRRRRNLHWTLWFALSYPFLLIAVGAAVGWFLLVGIVPGFRKIFEDFGTNLPELTKAIIELSNFLVAFWPWILGVFLVVSTAIGIIVLTMGNWLVTRKWSPFIPVVGPLFHLETLSEFCNLMAIFIDCQMTIPKSLRLASQATHDQWLQSACNNLATDIEQGHAGEKSALIVGIPVAISQLLCEGTNSQAMSEALRGLGELYSTRAEVNSRLVSIVAEPFVVILMAVALGSTVVALYMPLIKLLNDLS